jgi:hypothetical protein
VYYIFDTNIWIDLSRREVRCEDLLGKAGLTVALAPFIINEFIKGVVAGRGNRFESDRSAIECLASFKPEVLELPKNFIYRRLWNIRRDQAAVSPEQYRVLIDLVVRSKSLEAFLQKTDRSSDWQRIRDVNSIHKDVLDKELGSLGALAKSASLKTLAVHMVRGYELGGLIPDPSLFETTFSAALEFLKTSIVQVRRGAKPQKNNRGMYVDSQLFWYLADPLAVIVTREDFSVEIKQSPQKDRILSYEEFSRL